ncbi:MAG: hypothetical protein FWE29_01030 [Defluviitaleaceae bacterium]|nr:hypothetical protein [Defluviitaleaceae bacterium]
MKGINIYNVIIIALVSMGAYLLVQFIITVEGAADLVTTYGVMVAVALVLLYLAVKFIKTLKQPDNFRNILYDECDPVRFIEKAKEEVNSLLAEFAVKKNSIMKKSNVLRLAKNNLGTGYYANGDFDKAIEVLESINLKEKNSNDFVFNTIVHSNICSIQLQKGNIGGALKHYEAIKEYLAVFKDSPNKKWLEFAIEDLDAAFHLANGRYEKALEFYKVHTQLKSETKYGRVYANYNLAMAYEGVNDTEKQEEHYRYVAENGNLLYIAKIAREKLEIAVNEEG